MARLCFEKAGDMYNEKFARAASLQALANSISSSSPIRLLDSKSVEKHKKDHYNFIHFGMIQVAAKPLTRLGLNTSIVMCL